MTPYLLAFFIAGVSSVSGDRYSNDIVELTVPRTSVEIGKSSELYINVAVKEGLHLQANSVEEEFLIPTTLEVTSQENLVAERHEFPLGKIFVLNGTTDVWKVYDGEFKVRIVVTATGACVGDRFLRATLRYQACDAKRCFSPGTLDFVIPVTIS